MKIKNIDFTLVFIILLGLLTRLLVAFLPGFRIDMDTWFAWTQRLNQVGFANFYSDQIWTNYTPGYLYILSLLGMVKNLINIDTQSFYFILKLPSIIAELLVGLLIYKFIAKKSSKWAKIAALAVILNPAFIFNSSIWGQIDGLLTLFLILSVIFLHQKNPILSSIFFGLSLLIKPQAILLTPIFIFYLFNNFSLKNISKIIFPAFLTIYLFSFPFFGSNPFLGPIQLFSKMIGDYPYTSAFAYNLWGMIGFWISDAQKFMGITYRDLGFILLLIFWLIIGFFHYKKKVPVIILATLAAISFYFLPTRVHDRYLYPALVFLIIISAVYKSYILLRLALILSLIHFLNLYYVYIYYNELYVNLQKVLYHPFIYKLIDTYAKFLSLLSTVIFFLITVIIIKTYGKFKKI